VLIETTMRDPGDFAEPARMFRDAGYRVETAILAVPESLSRLGIQRYEEQRRGKGHGRLTLQSTASFTSAIDALAHRLPADLRPELDTIVALATPNMSVPEIGTEPPHRDADVAPAARYTAAAYPASTRSAVIEAGDQSASPRAGTPTNLGRGPSTQREHGSR